jgi:hypothetical protein
MDDVPTPDQNLSSGKQPALMTKINPHDNQGACECVEMTIEDSDLTELNAGSVLPKKLYCPRVVGSGIIGVPVVDPSFANSAHNWNINTGDWREYPSHVRRMCIYDVMSRGGFPDSPFYNVGKIMPSVYETTDQRAPRYVPRGDHKCKVLFVPLADGPGKMQCVTWNGRLVNAKVGKSILREGAANVVLLADLLFYLALPCEITEWLEAMHTLIAEDYGFLDECSHLGHRFFMDESMYGRYIALHNMTHAMGRVKRIWPECPKCDDDVKRKLALDELVAAEKEKNRNN